jgi:hypothetical protein
MRPTLPRLYWPSNGHDRSKTASWGGDRNFLLRDALSGPRANHRLATFNGLKGANVSAKAVTPAVDMELQPLIAEAKKLWATVKPSILELGRVFVKMRKTFSTHKKNPITDQTYTDAVAETGVPYATAEFYRQMAVTVDDPSKPIPQDTFLALYDNGVNLASDRFAKARYDIRVTGLNAYDSKEVDEVAKALKKDYPIPRESGVSVDSLAETINTIRANIEDPKTSVILKKTLKAALEEQQETARELEQSFKDKLTEIVQLLGGKGCDDPEFPWARAAQDALSAKLIALKLA